MPQISTEVSVVNAPFVNLRGQIQDQTNKKLSNNEVSIKRIFINSSEFFCLISWALARLLMKGQILNVIIIKK